jgi:hypothetical protein
MKVEEYITYLLSEPKSSSCVKIGEVLDISHDKVTRFLLNGNFTGKDLFEKASEHLTLFGGTLSIDDTVLDKPYTDINSNNLISFFYSGKHHKPVKGINLITLYYTDTKGMSLPVNFRIYLKEDGKTKNEYFRDMVSEVLKLGLKPELTTGDSWYASIENLKFLRKQGLSFLFGIGKDRIISSQKGVYQQVYQTEIPENGLYTHLKQFDYVKIFQMVTEHSRSTVDKDLDVRYYVYYHPQRTLGIIKSDFEKAHKEHWKIEIFHRICKQVCNLENFFVRKERSVKTHIFCALRAFIRLSAFVKDNIFTSHYSIQRYIFIKAQKQFILKYA